MSKVLVLGAAGMLGHKVCQELPGHEVVGTVRSELDHRERYVGVFDDVSLVGGVDVLDGDQLENALCRIEPDFVVNCVGLVKQLEQAADPYLAVAINALLPHRLARLCDRLDARLVHVSTDCVFDGERGAYLESDTTDALDLYGRSKALGETGVAETAAVTLRTSFIGRELGRPTHGLVEWLLAHEGGSVEGFAAVIYSGLTSLQLAAAIGAIIERRPDLHGTHHVASDPINKYDLLRIVREIYGLDIEIRRVEQPVSDRSLVRGQFSQMTGYAAPSWSQMIREMHEDPTPYGTWGA